eukprot:CAMPEP_0116079802 /NCGR_PEP_ID=MMETSP0327-20121206/1335_1 /TAXON_ID=44447 /ORGANISM="Pseudo-nitzschia delicatissima, Strain B596" /LENGTH=69 /DNA_ID=CAMNT_0003570449 /DNA_START=294 /DNA_END=500 /DNA_ORIENTATION=+
MPAVTLEECTKSFLGCTHHGCGKEILKAGCLRLEQIHNGAIPILLNGVDMPGVVPKGVAKFGFSGLCML